MANSVYRVMELIEIPEGYRKLLDCEKIQLGDLLWSSETKKFEPLRSGEWAEHTKADRVLCAIRKQETTQSMEV